MILANLFSRSPASKRDVMSAHDTWLINALGGQPSAAGQNVGESSALALPVVYACIRVLAESVAQLPLVLYHTVGRKREVAANHPLYRILHTQPNEEHTSFIWRELTMAHLAAWGNSYSIIYRNRSRQIAELWPLRPDTVQVRRVGGAKRFDVNLNGTQTQLGSDEVLHIPGIGYDGLTGWSPIRVHREAIGWGLATQDFSARFFGNGAQPQGVLTHPGVVNDPEKLRNDWYKRNSGENKQGVAVLQQGMKYEQIGIAPDDAQFVQTRALQIADICRIFNVPPSVVQDYGRATWNNAEQADLSFVKHTLVPWLTRIEAALNTSLLTPTEQKTLFFKFKVQGLLRGDSAGRAAFYASGVTNGWMTRNEVRELEDLDPIEGLDEPLTPVSAAQPMNTPAADEPKASAEPPPPDDGTDQARSVALAAAERVLGKELNELRRLRMSTPNHAEWLAAVNDFYRDHRKYIVQALTVTDETAGKFLDARWRDLQAAETVKLRLETWTEGGPALLLRAIRDANT